MIKLEIITPDRKVYDDDVDMIITRAADGDIGILPGHAPLISNLDITKVRIKKNGAEESIAVSHGFLEVRPDKVTILTESAELAGEIDTERAKEAKVRAEQRMKNSDADMERAELALKRAINRLSSKS